MNKISIIIPILNEAKTIGNLLQYLIKNASKENIAEIIVVDGGSNDGSKSVVTNFISGRAQPRPNYNLSIALEEAKIEFITSEKGRAKQMNTGNEFATGSILYFLHADSFPPKHFDQHIINEVEKNNLAGCFRMQFDNNHWWLRLASWLTQFHWRACRGGDQSLFITKTLFDDIGGYNESYMIYEDNILINELYKRNEFVVINKKLRTSARCYEKNGIWKLQYHFWTIYVKKWFGASAEELYSYYKKHIIS
ncbi:TIGR04283 family arsenosugar biosynthesis glycosyltransferase [Yeosuana sp. MJ-SS3]|jgi:rSAM/selenodomain-associated transferase 2|uniref:TIGR04283 family arsenosugar biosynthesis glycosyltransferase n=1 Tax=Gilvirhabdus luticola TaxID=3079858 RepID=A0ABU3U4V8_9FLAO|nr:TIGR04283 family arsenosugar biosynthesis glycosyltransferase [Yeosuana sp. MJ-SS3]MDU8885150.1 TIGR04283 family arsenosugar biosynthesis glycosyltransferase [Yeosuana sp. MJ-SS3]